MDDLALHLVVLCGYLWSLLGFECFPGVSLQGHFLSEEGAAATDLNLNKLQQSDVPWAFLPGSVA